jgi:hypothetical protein
MLAPSFLKLWAKYQTADMEVKDLQKEFERERGDMLEAIRDITKQLKLKQLVIDMFIPPEDQLLIEKRTTYEESDDIWTVAYPNMSGNVVAAKKKAAGGADKKEDAPSESAFAFAQKKMGGDEDAGVRSFIASCSAFPLVFVHTQRSRSLCHSLLFLALSVTPSSFSLSLSLPPLSCILVGTLLHWHMHTYHRSFLLHSVRQSIFDVQHRRHRLWPCGAGSVLQPRQQQGWKQDQARR